MYSGARPSVRESGGGNVLFQRSPPTTSGSSYPDNRGRRHPHTSGCIHTSLGGNRHTALFTSEYRSENAEIVYQEMRLGIITGFISYRASLGGSEKLGPAVAPGAAGAAGAAGGGATAGRELAGQYPPEFLARRM